MVVLFTLHAYRSWGPDNPRGYVRRDGQGIRPPDEQMARFYDRDARDEPRRFGEAAQQAIADELLALGDARDWHVHYICVTPTHVHTLLSWHGECEPDTVRATLKRRLGRALSLALDRPGPWFARGGSRKPERDPEHFEHLMHAYLPKPDHHGLHYRHPDRHWRQ